MNQEARKHLNKAEEYLSKGDHWYSKAADEIVAAKVADPNMSNREIGERFGRGEKWVRALVAWRTSSSPETSAPIDWQRGSHATAQEIEAGVQRHLAEADPAEIAQAIPADKRRRVSEALGQLHPATGTRAPLGIGAGQKYGFALEMGAVSQRLLSAIDAYVDAWEDHAPTAKEEELQIERDLLAPKILRLRMTVEEVEVP